MRTLLLATIFFVAGKTAATAQGCTPTSSTENASACYSYTWHDSTYKRTGTYTFTTRNVAGCDSVITLNLTITSLSSTFTKTKSTCYNSNTGCITVHATSGVAPYQYRLGTGGAWTSSNSFKNLRAGTYRIYLKDTTGCLGLTAPIAITQPLPISANMAVKDASCYVASDGEVKVTPTNGMAPFEFKIGTTGTLQSSNTFSNLRSGTYRITLVDWNGCTGIVPAVVNQPTQIVASASKTDASCKGATDGTITVTATGGVGKYRYQLSTGTVQYSGYFSGLHAGTYKVYVTDSTNCSAKVISATVYQPTTPCTNFSAGRAIVTGEANELQVAVAPNPSAAAFKVTVNGTAQMPVDIRVINVEGKIAFSKKGFANQTFSFGEDLKAGVYMIQVTQGQDVKTLKVMKVN